MRVCTRLLVCLALPAVATAAPAPWPVPNADFEQVDAKGFPANWRHGFHDGDHYSFEVVEEDENHFLRITGKEPTGRAYWSQVLPTRKAPRAFRVRLRYRGTTSQMDGFVRFRNAEDFGEELSMHRWTVRPNSREWVTFEREFGVPKNAREAVGVSAEVILYARGTGALDYDDFSLEPLEAFNPTWPNQVDPLAMPFRPHDKMTCQQNPPDFSWPAVEAADAYALQVAREADFATVGHEATNLRDNFHNFPATFAPGTWHWRARFRVDDNWSKWTEPRRFRIAPDAWPFPVPTIDDLVKRVPESHPRIWTTRDTLADFRARAEGPRKEWFAGIEARVRRELATPPAAEPTFAFDRKGPLTAEWVAAHNKLRGAGEGAAEKVRRTAFVYLVTGDEAIGRNAVAQMLNLASWDPDGATGYATHDQVHRAITWKTAVAYDWCHDLLTAEKRQQVLDMVRTRTLTMYRSLAESRPLKQRPYDSHGWTAFGYMGVVAIALLHDLPEAEEWFRELVPSYINLLPPWGDEDGGWCQGTDYWQYSSLFNKTFMDALLYATDFSLYDKAFSRNSRYFPLYTLPHGSPRSHFGDGNRARPCHYHTSHYARLGQLFQDPVCQWAKDAIGTPPGGGLRAYFTGDDDLPARPPFELPRAKWFRDIDWVCMHSDLVDPERISLYFKSSPMGSFNHSHADQNSFVLNAFGEALAIDSGYYDWYGSPHDKAYTRQTLAHNAITHDGGQGQPIFDVTAKGKVTGFVTHPAMDACTGDATPAYHGGLGRAVRHVIYLRPDTFVLIDDLAAADGKASPFEWWLHGLTPGNLAIGQGGNGEAVVTQGEARLRVQFHHPAGMVGHQRDEFIGPPGVYPEGEEPTPVRPQGRGANWPDQAHVWFATPEVEATKIVSTLQAYRAEGQPSAISSQPRGDHVELGFGSGARVFVRLGDEGEVATAGLTFDGAAAAVADEAVLLVAGTKLVRGGDDVVSAAQPVTVVLGGGEACVSCTDDTIVRLRAPGTTRIRDGRNRDLPREWWTQEGDMVKLSLEPRSHTLRFNDAPAPGPAEPVAVPVEVDGQVEPLLLEAMRGVDGTVHAWGNLPTTAGLYTIASAPAGLRLRTGPALQRPSLNPTPHEVWDSRNASGSPAVWLSDGEPVTLTGAPSAVRLRRLNPGETIELTLSEDLGSLRKSCSVWQEAETFVSSGDGSFERYSHRPFLSGGVGVGHWETPGQWLTWKLDVPKSGKYDLVLKLATHVGATRFVQLGDTVRRFHVPAGPGYGAEPGEWRGVRVPLQAKLAAGHVELTMWHEDGLLNLDWIGLAPAG